MALKNIPERLLKDELIYELRVRHIPAGGLVKELRVAYRKALKEVRDDSEVLIYPYSFTEDCDALEKGKETLKKLLIAFETSPVKETGWTIETKLSHYINRVNNSRPVTEEEELTKEQYTSDFSMIMLEYQVLSSKSDEYNLPSVSESQPVNLNSNITSLNSNSSPSVEPRTVPVKPTPVVKWNLKFSGDARSMSLSAFLERVDELVIARSVNLQQLFDEAIDLFTGRALIWFRANRAKASSWPALVALLNKEFRPIDYDERLIDEIKRRTQGVGETVSIYVSIMLTMFARLLEPLDDHKKLRIILRNLTPEYQSQLGLTIINTFDELLTYGRTIEERRFAIDNYVPPSRRKCDLETDLAYLSITPGVPKSHTPDVATVSTPINNYGREQNFNDDSDYRGRDCGSISRGRGSVGRGRGSIDRGRGRGGINRGSFGQVSSRTAAINSCWNCNSSGHFSSNCPEPQNHLFCYRCGAPNVTTRTCHKCNQGYRSSENNEGSH